LTLLASLPASPRHKKNNRGVQHPVARRTPRPAHAPVERNRDALRRARHHPSLPVELWPSRLLISKPPDCQCDAPKPQNHHSARRAPSSTSCAAHGNARLLPHTHPTRAQVRPPPPSASPESLLHRESLPAAASLHLASTADVNSPRHPTSLTLSNFTTPRTSLLLYATHVLPPFRHCLCLLTCPSSPSPSHPRASDRRLTVATGSHSFSPPGFLMRGICSALQLSPQSRFRQCRGLLAGRDEAEGQAASQRRSWDRKPRSSRAERTWLSSSA
jgi:hypothetical protein